MTVNDTTDQVFNFWWEVQTKLVNYPVHVYVVTQRHQENNGNLKDLVKIYNAVVDYN